MSVQQTVQNAAESDGAAGRSVGRSVFAGRGPARSEALASRHDRRAGPGMRGTDVEMTAGGSATGNRPRDEWSCNETWEGSC
ncbi:hypothetical protein CRG98_003553 [Punica granatum]|uniref:Uncharacterized protein n=1 Tax=Punica granatum TaxID=22663 RepID=A0A2I0L5W5_PUNGR|nr:hypothetical protein CRG98_003553 [Punica granatum]